MTDQSLESKVRADSYRVNHLLYTVQYFYLTENSSYCEKKLLRILVCRLDQHPFAHSKRLLIIGDQVYLIFIIVNKLLEQMHIPILGNLISVLVEMN